MKEVKLGTTFFDKPPTPVLDLKPYGKFADALNDELEREEESPTRILQGFLIALFREDKETGVWNARSANTRREEREDDKGHEPTDIDRGDQ